MRKSTHPTLSGTGFRPRKEIATHNRYVPISNLDGTESHRSRSIDIGLSSKRSSCRSRSSGGENRKSS